MVLGIIAEYNPFHNGHIYHLLKSKEITKDTYSIAVIGGNFTQRGETSLIDKWTKAEMAISNGIDLIIELPTIYSVSSAENFAEGSIKILNSLKIVDHVSFGAESDELNKLNIITNTLFEEPNEFKTILTTELSKGLSYPKAREIALANYLNDSEYSNILSKPNNILAIEYLKALKKYKSKIKPCLIKRKDSSHLNPNYTGNITSATSIRNMISTKNTANLKNALTPNSYTILINKLEKGHFVNDFSYFETIILYKLRTTSLEYIKNLPDVSEGLEFLLKKASFSCNSINELINIVCSKRYTITRIKRILLYLLLDITKKEMAISKKTTPYIRILGFNKKGKYLLSEIKKNNPHIKIITSVKKFMNENKNKNLNILLNKDILATNIYTLGFKKDPLANLDFTKKILTLNTQ